MPSPQRQRGKSRQPILGSHSSRAQTHQALVRHQDWPQEISTPVTFRHAPGQRPPHASTVFLPRENEGSVRQDLSAPMCQSLAGSPTQEPMVGLAPDYSKRTNLAAAEFLGYYSRDGSLAPKRASKTIYRLRRKGLLTHSAGAGKKQPLLLTPRARSLVEK